MTTFRQELDGLRAAIQAPPAPTSPVAPRRTAEQLAAAAPICRLDNREDLDQAFRDPGGLPDCIPVSAEGQGEVQDSGARHAAQRPAIGLAQAVQQPLPDRPNIAPGVSTTLSFASSTQATVTYTHPIILRSRATRRTREGERFEWFRPQLLTISGGLTVPVANGESILFSATERADRADADILPGTTFRLGVDFMSFRQFDRLNSFRRTVSFLYSTMRACVAATPGAVALPEPEFNARYGVARNRDRWTLADAYIVPNPTNAPCLGANLIDFVLATEDDPTTSAGVRFVRAPLAADLQATFWSETTTAIPEWGAGFSVQYGSSDFRYSQGAVALVPSASDPSRLVTRLDTSALLAAERTDTEDDWLIQGYASRFQPLRDLNDLPPSGVYTNGVQFLVSASYRSSYQFRPGTTALTICPSASVGVINRCSAVNVDRPFIRDGISLTGEARLQFNNIPVIGVLGFGPRYTYRLSDDRQVLDVPIYLSANASGLGSAGIRFRHSWDGDDLLGNPERANTEWLVFVTALTFRAF